MKKQGSIDKEIIKMGKNLFKKNSFYEAKSQFEQIGKSSAYFIESQKYLKQIELYPKAEESCKKALAFWKEGKIEPMIEKCDEASQLVPQYKKPAELKKKALAMKDLLSKLENAEADGDIQDIERTAREIQSIVKNRNNVLYKMAQEKISKIEFGKHYKANKYYLAGMRQLAEGRYNNALRDFDKARQLVPKNKSYDIRYRETSQKLRKSIQKIFFAAYVLAEKDPGRAKKILQKILKMSLEDDPYYIKALELLEQ